MKLSGIRAGEALLASGAGHGHEHQLARLQRAQPQGALGRIRIALQVLGRLAFRKLVGAGRRLLRALEVRDAVSERIRKARHAPLLQDRPIPSGQLLPVHGPGGKMPPFPLPGKPAAPAADERGGEARRATGTLPRSQVRLGWEGIYRPLALGPGKALDTLLRLR